MSNPFGWLTPPGCGTNDTGPMGEDGYNCEACGRTCTQEELDSGEEDAVCRECVEMREEEAKAIHPTVAMNNALEAVLLFHSTSPWTEEKRQRWFELITSVLPENQAARAGDNPLPVAEATTRVLCDTVRAALALARGGAK